MSEVGTARLFFALWPADAARQATATSYRERIAQSGGRAVPPGNLHLTLEFLGAVQRTRLESLRSLGTALARPATPLVLDELRWWRAVGALVAVASVPPPGLLAVQAELRERLVGEGFAIDARPFRPHVTLARRVTAAPPLSPAPAVAWPVAELALIETLQAPGGSRYVALARWPCGREPTEFGGH